MVSFTAMTKFMVNQKTHVVEKEFFEIFLPFSFRLIRPQIKQGNMHLHSAEIGLKVLSLEINPQVLTPKLSLAALGTI